jgi:hypothetical protein
VSLNQEANQSSLENHNHKKKTVKVRKVRRTSIDEPADNCIVNDNQLEASIKFGGVSGDNHIMIPSKLIKVNEET